MKIKVIAYAVLFNLLGNYGYAQDLDININPQEAFILNKTNGALEVKICNCHTADVTAPANKLRPQISFPDNLLIKSVTAIDGSALTDFSILSSSNDPGNHTVRLIATSPLANASCLSFLVHVQGEAVGTGTITATLGFEGPQTADNNPANDNAIAAIPVQINFPVELKEFLVKKFERTAILEWATTEETNASHFEVQRSGDGKVWNTLTTVAAKGDSKVQTNYTASDPDPLNGENLYRLHMVDIDGSSAYSTIRQLRFEFQPNVIFPNPAKDFLHIQTDDWSKVRSVTIRNSRGEQVYYSVRKRTVQIELAQFTAGIYTVEIVKSNGEISISRIAVVK